MLGEWVGIVAGETPTAVAEIVSDDFPVLLRAAGSASFVLGDSSSRHGLRKLMRLKKKILTVMRLVHAKSML
jgi:hypothetical protein